MRVVIILGRGVYQCKGPVVAERLSNSGLDCSLVYRPSASKRGAGKTEVKINQCFAQHGTVPINIKADVLYRPVFNLLH